ncbi:PAS domain-containing hybrid sensor histidine kinase/response regulator [Zoogloea dura]|uniref:Virulence sensor protein BvgS n=1 Tax=Zoogloea dura TaxID=2728840 RepID=A0A848G1V2_9RHOO|nr:PAS domain-containing hybrid sensor histidine kinase/response regulator [Zoogloea dura]NML24423.1 response regulator [Zoogloea dura]
MMLEVRMSVGLGVRLRVLSVDPNVADLLGYGVDDLVCGSVHLCRLIHPDDSDIVQQMFHPGPTSAPQSTNIRIRHLDGRIRCIRAEYSRCTSHSGGVELHLLLQDAKSLPRTMPDAASIPTLRAMLENTDDFIYFKDRNHVFTGASQTLVSLCEPVSHWTDFIGKTDYDVFPEAYADIYYRLEKTVFNGCDSAQDIQQTLTRDGKRGWVDNRKYPIHDDAGVLIGLYGVARDITEIKQAQANLEHYSDQLEEQVQQRTIELSAIFDAAPIGIVLLRDRVVLKCNRAFESLFGCAEGELIGQSTRDWYKSADEFMAAGEHVYGSLQGGVTVHREQELLRKDGTRFLAHISIRLLVPTDPYGAALATIADITQERAIACEQKAVFDAATVGIILSRDQLIVHCNQTMEELFGYESGELSGKATSILYPDPLIHAEVNQKLTAALTETGYLSEERQLVRKDGSTFWCRMSVRALYPNHPERGFAGTFEDVSVERRALEEMASARNIAEDAASTKAAFLANMSHEIRTPMNAVIGMTHLAIKANPPPKVLEYLEKISGASQHLLSVINDILDYSKLDAGKTILEHDNFSLQKVIDDLSSIFGEKAAGKGLEFVVNIKPDVPLQLVGDVFRLEQVLINLIGNAIKFTETGYVELIVSVEERSAEWCIFKFSVCDSGIGISETQQQTLFKSFHQADTSTTRRFGGSGLGLAIALGLARLMCGDITVESLPGHGSVFNFTARLDVGENRESEFLDHPDLRVLRTLIVDDNTHAREVLEEMSCNMGFSTRSVATGEDALAEIQRAELAGKPYHLIVLDWKMPDMDGIQVAHEIPAMLGHEAPATIIVTAYDRDEVTSVAAKEGVKEVLTKPVTASTLFNAVMHQFGRVSESPSVSAVGAEITGVAAEFLGRRVLVAEDNELSQEVAKGLLTSLGIDVDIASDGACAVEMVQQATYDLVFMDMQMPVVDGLAATRMIRAIERLKSLPIIAMTANVMASDRQHCIEAGMNDHIGKPIDPLKLNAMLRKWLVGQVPSHVSDESKETVPDGSSIEECAPQAHLDYQRGLRQVSNNEELYYQVIEHFVFRHAGAVEQIIAAVRSEDWKGARFLSHNLKGTSSQIGATSLRKFAERLQNLTEFEQAGEELETTLQGARQELLEVIREAHIFLSQA